MNNSEILNSKEINGVRYEKINVSDLEKLRILKDKGYRPVTDLETLKELEGFKDSSSMSEGLKSFGYGMLKPISADYPASIGKLIGSKSLENFGNEARRNIEDNYSNSYSGMLGEIAGDPMTYTPMGLYNKGKRAVDFIKSLATGGAIGASSQFARDYGNQDLTNSEKLQNSLIAGGITGGLAGGLSQVFRKVPTPQSTLSPQNLQNGLAQNGEEFGLNSSNFKQTTSQNPQPQAIQQPQGVINDNRLNDTTNITNRDSVIYGDNNEINKVEFKQIPKPLETPQEALDYILYGKKPMQTIQVVNDNVKNHRLENQLFASPHIGSGVVGGTANATEIDENGNMNIDPEKFVTGFLAGMGASKVGAMTLRQTNPNLYNNLLGIGKKHPNMAKSNPTLLAKIYNSSKDSSTNMFAGEKALSANISNLQMAKELEKSGANEVDIWKNTSWFKGDDGEWRFEINDSDVTFNDNLKVGKYKLSEIFNHDKLFENYPELKDFEVKVENNKGAYYRGYYTNKSITLNKATEGVNKSTLLHEIQHGIQGFENFGQGADPRLIFDLKIDPILKTPAAKKLANIINPKVMGLEDKSKIKKIVDNVLQKPKYYGLKEMPTEDDIRLIYEMVDKGWSSVFKDYVNGTKRSPLWQSERVHGEAEARLTQNRANKGYDNFPYDDLDVPRNEIKDDAIDFMMDNMQMSPVKSKKQKEQRATFNVQFNGKKSANIYRDKDFRDVENAIKFERGKENIHTGKGFGALHIEKHIGDDKDGWITVKEFLNMGNAIRNVEPYLKNGKRVYEYRNNFGDRFRIIIGDDNKRERVITFYSNRKAGFGNDSQNYIYNQPSNETLSPQNLEDNKLNPNMRGGFVDNQLISDGAETIKDSWDKLKILFSNTLPRDYMGLREETITNMSKASHQMETLHKALKRLDENDRVALHEYMVGDKVDIKSELKTIGDSFRAEVKDLEKELVTNGVLSQEAFDEWSEKYLHRIYKGSFKNSMNNLFSRGFTVDKIRQRGLKLKTRDNKRVIEFVNDFLKSKNLEPLNISSNSIPLTIKHLENMGLIGKVGDGKINYSFGKNGKITLNRDYTYNERTEMGEIRDIAVTLPETILRLKKLKEHSNLLKEVQQKSDIISDAETDGFKQLKVSSMYGVLSGKYVREDVYYDLVKMGDDIHGTIFGNNSLIAKLWLGYLRIWKKAKTVWHAPAHLNNLISNIFLMNVAGVPAKNIVSGYGKAIQMMKNAKKLDELEQLKLLNIATKEQLDELDDLIKNQNMGLYKEAKELGILGRSQINEMLRSDSEIFGNKNIFSKADDFMSKLYQNEDAVNRLIAYKFFREKNFSKEKAKEIVTDIMPDYTKPLPQGYRLLKDSGVSPFISWSYYVLPKLIRRIATTKAGATSVITVLSTLGALEYILSDISPLDHMPFMDTDLPDDFKGRKVAIGKSGDTIHTLNADKMVPYLGLLNPQNFASGLLSGVSTSMAFNAIEGLNPNMDLRRIYDGRAISSKTKSTSDRAIDYIKYLAQQYVPLPQQAYSTYNYVEAMNKPEHRRKVSDVVLPKTTAQGLLQLLGINLRDYSANGLKREQYKKE